MLIVHDVEAHLELEVGDGGYEITIAASFSDAVDRTLHVGRPGLDSDQRVSHAASGVVVGVDADLDLRELPDRATDDGLQLRRQRAAVGVAED